MKIDNNTYLKILEADNEPLNQEDINEFLREVKKAKEKIMTKKEIIIDGVDVSKCKYFHKKMSFTFCDVDFCDVENACEKYEMPCENLDECTYKRIQRLESEE